MFKFLKRWLQPRPYVVIWPSGLATKVMTRLKPDTFHWKVLGPLRSELDAEELCDRLNHALRGYILTYHPSPITLNKEPTQDNQGD